jgi:large subunit ribosomal protein L22
MITKVLRSAAANAENNQTVECDTDEMYVTCATVDGGPSMSRYRFGARGRIVPRKKRTSHITIGLSEKTSPEEASKENKDKN